MDEIMDTKVVQMKFDNSQFRAGVQDTIRQLDNLDKSLELKGASDGLDAVTKASKQTTKSMDSMAESVQTVQVAFSYLEVAGITAMVRLTNAALNYGKRIANNLWSKSIGQVIEGGKRRSQNISNAKFQLEGLGVAWDDIVDDINYGVKDTAYGLDEAATAASQLVASQVALGDEMKTALRGISGTAAMTNSTFSEISNIWTTVASNGKLMTMQLRQLSARGLNASAVLAKAMGTTEAAINDMVTKGQIDFKTFAEAMDNAFGEHAKEANKTFQGALSNMNAALSRIGQKFADPVFENLRKTFIALTHDIDNIKEALAPIMNLFESVFNAGERIVEAFLTNEHFVKGLINLALDFYSYVRVIYGAVAEMLPTAINVGGISKNFEEFAKSLQLYGDNAIKVKDVIKDIISVIDIFIHGIKSALTVLRPFGEAILEGIGIPIQKIKDNFKPGFIYEHRDALKAIMNAIAKFLALKLADAIHAIGQAIKSINWKAVLGAVVILVNSIPKAVNFLAKLVHVVKSIFGSVIAVVYAAGMAVMGFIGTVAEAWNSLVSLFGPRAQAALSFYTPVISIGADTEAVDKAAEQSTQTVNSVTASADQATESVQELNDAISETSDRLEITEKHAGRTGEKIDNSYTQAAKVAEDSADRIEDANDRIAVSNKGLGPRTDPRERDRGTRSDPTRDIERQKTGIETTIAGFGDLLNGIEKDTSGQTAAASVLDIWFGGIADTIKSVCSSWFAKIALFVMKMGPVLAIIAVFAVKIAWSVTMFKVIAGVIGSIVSILKGIADAVKSIGLYARALYKSAVAKEIEAMANMLKALAAVLLSVAAMTAVIVGAAYLIDRFDLQDTINTIFAWSAGILIIIGIIMTVYGWMTQATRIKLMFDSITRTITSIRLFFAGGTSTQQRPKDTITSVVHELALMCFALVAALGTLIAGVVLIGRMPLWEIVKGAGTLFALSIMLVGFIILLVNVGTKLTTYTYAYEQAGISKALKGRERGIERSGTAIHNVLMAFAGVLAVMVAATVIFGKMKPNELKQGMFSLIASMALLTVFLGVMIKVTQDVTDKSTKWTSTSKKLEKTSKNITGGSNADALGALPKIITAISAYMWAVSRALKAAKSMNPAQLGVATGLLATVMGGLTGLMAVIAYNARQNQNTDEKELNKAYSGIAKVIAAVSIYMLAISASLMMLGTLDSTQMAHSMGALVIALILLGGFMTVIPGLIKGFELSEEFQTLAKGMLAISGSLAILMLATSVMFTILQDVNWSAMEGSAKYLIGMAVFIAGMTVIIGLLTVIAGDNAKTVVAASVGVFLSMSVMMLALSNLFAVMDTVDWGAVEKALPVIISLEIFFVAIGALAIIISQLGPAAGLAMAAIGVIAGLILAVGGMFYLIGKYMEMVGEAVFKIARSIDIIINIPWEKTDSAVHGLVKLLAGFKEAAGYIDLELFAGALIFASFTGLMAFAIKQLEGIDPSTVNQVGKSINTFVSTIAEDLETKKEVMDVLTGMATLLPIIAGALAASAIALAVGGLGLIVFAGEMLIFTQLMAAVGEQIVPSVQTIVTAITSCSGIIFNSGLELLAGFAALFAVATLCIVVGTLLTAGGLVMTLGSELIYLSALMLGVGIENLVNAISNSGTIILQNAMSLITGVQVLAGFAVVMTTVGALLIVGGTTFSLGAALTLLGAKLLLSAVNTFGNASVSAAVYAANTVQAFDQIVEGATDLVYDLTDLGEAMKYAGEMATAGFVEGIEEGAQMCFASMTTLGGGIIAAFNGRLGIESPATEFISSAFWSIEGYLEGLTENMPRLQDGCVAVVDTIVGIFNGGADGVGAAGETAALNFGTGISGMVEQYIPDLENIFDALGIDLGDLAGLNMENAFGDHLRNMVEYAQEVAGNIGYGYWTSDQRQAFGHNPRSGNLSIADVQQAQHFNNQAQHDNWWANYVPVDTEDVSYGWLNANDYYRSFGGGGGAGGAGIDTTSALASAISGSSGAGSGINDASKGSAIGTGGSTVTNNNNTYNFYQTNYSPEPLDRSAIYQQTRNQFNSFYAYAKEKNLSY